MIAGFSGAGMGGLTFMTMHNLLTQKLYGGPTDAWYSDLDFRIKNLMIFTASDLVASITKVPFETRKQLVQMSNYDMSIKLLAKNTAYGLVPLVARDVSFRFVILGSYYLTTDIMHRPSLKYSIPQIMDFLRMRREQGHSDSL